MSECRSCHQPVRWVVMKSGKKMPIDDCPTDVGNVIVADGIAYVLKAADFAKLPANTARYVSHFATCSAAAEHRKPKSGT